MQKQFHIQGHRGARGHFPENTIPGFIKAIEFGADTLELDVVISADRQIVVSHEAWMNEIICSMPDGTRIPTGKGKEYNLYRMEYDEIKAFDCGRTGHPEFPLQAAIPSSKPLLRDVFTSVDYFTSQHQYPAVSYNIELKTEEGTDLFNPAPAIFAKLVLEEVFNYQNANRISFSSFDLLLLRELKKQNSSLRIGQLVENSENLKKNLDRLGFIPDTYNPDFNLVNEQLVEDAHRLGIQVIPWTVNEKKDMTLLMRIGVDGIITDYPDRLADLVKNNRDQT